MEDIRVDDDWQVTRAADGDAPTVSGTEEFLQSVRLESMTQEGDLFYDPEYGWSLLDFIHSTDSELARTAIRERVRGKMAKRTDVDISSLQVEVEFWEDALRLGILFKRKDRDDQYRIGLLLDRVRLEVTEE